MNDIKANSVARRSELNDERELTVLLQLQIFRGRTLTFPQLGLARELLQSGHGACRVVNTLRRLRASVGFGGGIMF